MNNLAGSLPRDGCTGFHEVTKSHVAAAPPVTMPHVFSAFPLLNLADDGYGGR